LPAPASGFFPDELFDAPDGLIGVFGQDPPLKVGVTAVHTRVHDRHGNFSACPGALPQAVETHSPDVPLEGVQGVVRLEQVRHVVQFRQLEARHITPELCGVSFHIRTGEWFGLQYIQASRRDRTTSSTSSEALPIILILRARYSIDLTCSTMTKPVTFGLPVTGT